MQVLGETFSLKYLYHVTCYGIYEEIYYWDVSCNSKEYISSWEICVMQHRSIKYTVIVGCCIGKWACIIIRAVSGRRNRTSLGWNPSRHYLGYL